MSENQKNEIQTRLPDYDIHPLFIERWSPRSFSNETLSNETLLGILEAGRWAPSASNLQPWRFIVARTAEEKAKFYPFIAEGNREWCEKASVLLLLLSYTQTPNGQLNSTHAFDAGTCWGYLALEATNHGCISHAMAGFDSTMARQVLQIPSEYSVHIVIALGYQGEKTQLSEKLQQRETPNTRRPLHESIYAGEFGTPFSL